MAFFRSFMTVASGFILAQMIYLGLALALGYLFFPQFLAAFELDEVERQQIVAENIHSVIPWPMFIIHVLLSLIAFWFVGWLVAALSPAAHFRHGLFVAFLVFLWFLQGFAADADSKKLMNFVQMLILPIPLIYGARRASQAFQIEQNE